jgi:hypothetical protein
MSAKNTGRKKPAKVSKAIKELLEESARDDLIIKPPYEKFLSEWNETYSPRVVQRIAEVLSTPPRDRRYTWSASGAGKCLRRQELAFLGMPQLSDYNPQQRRIFLNGTWVHLRNQAVMMEAGILDNIEVTVRRKKDRARCTMDGMGVVLGGRYEGADFGFELKSANDNDYNRQITKGARDATRMQVDFEMYLTGFDLFTIINENKNNQGIQEWVVVRDEDRIAVVKEMLQQLNRAVDYHHLDPMIPECQKRLKAGEFYKCPFGGDGGICASVGKWPNRIPT